MGAGGGVCVCLELFLISGADVMLCRDLPWLVAVSCCACEDSRSRSVLAMSMVLLPGF